MNTPQLTLLDTSMRSTVQRNSRILLCFMYGLMAHVYTSLFFKVTIDVGPSGLVSLANFTASRPYQYRVLIPAIVHLLARITHADSYQVLTLYRGVEVISVFAAFWMFRAYLSTFVDVATASVLTFFLLPAMLLIHTVCALGHYPYDTPQIVLFTLGLVALRKQNWLLFYLTLAVATVNRETSCMLIPAFGLTMYGALPRRQFSTHLAAQSLIFAAIKLSIDHIFAHNPGGFTEDHVAYNIDVIRQIFRLNQFVVSMALLWAAIIWQFVSGRAHIPTFAARLLWLIPMYVAAMWRFGLLDEIRAYNEMVPVFLTPLLLVFLGTLKAGMAEQGDGLNAEASGPMAKAA
jgi:hypothetical protein